MLNEVGLSRGTSEGKTWKLAAMMTVALVLVAVMMVLGGKPAFAAGTVTVSVAGKGDATGPGINCNESGGPDCSEFYADITTEECDDTVTPPRCFTLREPPTVEVTAGADRNGYTFAGWTGCDAVTGRTCEIMVSSSRGVTLSLADVQQPVVTNLTPGSGVQRGMIALGANASDNSGAVSRVEFRVRGQLIATDTSAPYSASFNTSSVSDGSAEIRATAFDASGNSSLPATSTVVIDNTAPTLSITGGPDGQTFGPGSTQTWTFSAADATSGIQSVQCSVVSAGSAPSFGACSGGAGSHSVTNRPEGSYTFTVKARDNGGLESTRSREFFIDATPPQTTITSGPADGERTNQTTLTWNFSSSETGSTFQCRIYPAALTPPAFSECSGSGTHTASGFSSGTYTFEVRATDTVGNTDITSAKRTITVDTVNPGVSSVTPAHLEKKVAPTANVTATFSEAMNANTLNKTTFKLVRKGTRTAVGAGVSLAGNRAVLNPNRNLVRGATYTATVTTGARDLAGNPLSASKTWTFTVKK
ncbi:Ig-like domain-containing protein [Rubrobacter indicoceani]|uniref:Ig-like domain-containing protein n=1 Tax=Rubrobacter indicoceani TaxID=2051957 RepID=UPI000E5B66B8|nr:Ig-like domain-containing protein [Rubrobacter indicoceani]